MRRRIDSKRGASRDKRRKVIQDEMLSSESTIKQSGDESNESADLLGLRQRLFENRKPRWDALFEKYELKSEEGLEDDISIATGSGGSKEYDFRSRRSAMKLRNWHEGFNSSSISEPQNQQPAKLEVVEKNENIGTMENSIIDERAVRKSGSMINVASHFIEKDKIKSTEKDINQNVRTYQLRSRKNREGNFEKERKNDMSQGFISNGIIKKHQENICESGTFQNTKNFDQLHHHENPRVNDSRNESNNIVENRLTDKRASRKSRSVCSGASDIGKRGKIKCVKEGIDQNLHQLHSRKNREDNSEKERKNDMSQSFISNGIIKKHQENIGESGTFQNTKNFDQLHQHENSRVNDSRNESNNIVENRLSDKRAARKSRSVCSGASDIVKRGKIKSVKEDVDQNIHQLHSRKNREDNSEKERKNDRSQGYISNGIIKKHQENICESGTFQNTKKFDQLHQHENSRVNDSRNEGNNIVENPLTDKRAARKSRSVCSGASDIGKRGKIKCVKKDIDQNMHQLHSRKNREDNSEKERKNDVSHGFISSGIIKEHQQNICESRTFQNTKKFERFHRHKNSSVNDSHNESDNKSCLEVHLEKQEQIKKDSINPIIPSKHIPKKMKKEYSNGDLKFLYVKNISRNSPCTKLGIALKVKKQNCIIESEKHENTAHHSLLSDLNFSIDSVYVDSKDFSLQPEKTFVEQESKNIRNNSVMFPKEKGREISDWNTEFLNFIKYQWNDFRKNPGSMLFPLPKLKPSGRGEKLSWENIMNGN